MPALQDLNTGTTLEARFNGKSVRSLDCRLKAIHSRCQLAGRLFQSGHGFSDKQIGVTQATALQASAEQFGCGLGPGRKVAHGGSTGPVILASKAGTVAIGGLWEKGILLQFLLKADEARTAKPDRAFVDVRPNPSRLHTNRFHSSGPEPVPKGCPRHATHSLIGIFGEFWRRVRQAPADFREIRRRCELPPRDDYGLCPNFQG